MGRHHTSSTWPETPAAACRGERNSRRAEGLPARDRSRRRLTTGGLAAALSLAIVSSAFALGSDGSVETSTVAAWGRAHSPHAAQRTVEEVSRESRTAPPSAAPTVAEQTDAEVSEGGPIAETTAASPDESPTSSAPTSESSSAETAATPVATSTGLLAASSGNVGGVLASASELAEHPTSGSAWNALLTAANKHSGTVDLANQDSTHAAQTLASALVYARTGDTGQRDYVVGVLRRLPGSSLSSARVLSVSRQLGGYVLAADLVGYRDPSFVSWVGGMRTRDIGNHGRWTTITFTSEDSASNWGAWAMATRIAISAYLGDSADLQRAATVFRGFTGEASAYTGFRKTSDFDPGWACGDAWVPINPASCGARSGAIVEDISRSAGSYPTVDSTGLTYSWEVLGGATMSARILERAGYRDVWQWGDQALLRAASFLESHGGYAPRYNVNQYIPHEINAAYGTDLGPVGAVGYGRQFGFTDWLT